MLQLMSDTLNTIVINANFLGDESREVEDVRPFNQVVNARYESE